MSERVPVMVESPYKGEVSRNMAYLARCIEDSLSKNEAPFASHGFYTFYLDDKVPEERMVGIECGLAWGKLSSHVFYTDYGWTTGMLLALEECKASNRAYIQRQIGVNPNE